MKNSLIAGLAAIVLFAAGCGGTSPAGDVLTAITPEDGATGVPVTQTITATFGSDLDETTLTAANITLTRTGAINVPGAIAYDAATRTLTFTPDSPMLAGTLHTFTISANARTKATGDYVMTFTTQETPVLFTFSDNEAASSPFDLWSMNADGSSQTNLTAFGTRAAGSFNLTASWSPDFTRIAFIGTTGDPSDRQDLYVMNADGSDRINLTNGAANYSVDLFKWAPDGSKIYFIFTNDDDAEESHYDIGSVSPDGTGLTNLTNLAATMTAMGPNLQLSPDGAKLYYCAGGVGEDDPYDIYSIGNDGTGNVNLTNMPAGSEAVYQLLSPDGTKLYYSGSSAASEYGLYSINVDGSNVQTVVAPVANRPVVAWEVSPDGSQLVATTITGGVAAVAAMLWDVVIANTDGSGMTPLTAASGSTMGVVGAWSPDGTKVAYVYGDPTSGPLDIFVADRYGANPVNITDFAAGSMVLIDIVFLDSLNVTRWSPDGSQILFTQVVDDGVNYQMNVIAANVDDSGLTALTSVPPPQEAVFISWW